MTADTVNLGSDLTSIDLISIHSRRLVQARAQLRAHGLDFLVVGPSADLLYLLGAHTRPSERMSLLILPQEGPAYMLTPAFEAPSLPSLPPEVQIVLWGESDNPARIAAGLVSGAQHMPGGAHCTVGVGDRLWSVFLLRLQAELPRATFTPGSTVMAGLRQIKSPEEIALLCRSGAAADAVFNEIAACPFAGRSEEDVAREIAALLKEKGLTVEGLPIVASGPNSASPHHHAGERTIEPGDLVVLDFGGTLEGYYSDITRTVFVGAAPEPNSEEERVYNLVAGAQEAAVRAAYEGMTCEQLDEVARSLLTEAGYGQYFMHRLGHGIGLDGHEPPYLVQGSITPLQVGMAFSVEPGIYIPGKFGVRVEDTVYLSEDGAVRANNATREIVTVG